MASTPFPTEKAIPLVLDLDGTLIRTDTFHEMLVQLLFKKPWLLLLVPLWLLKGRPFAKAQLVDATHLSPRHLPYNLPLLAFAKEEAKKGRPLILATGTDQRLAQKIADHLGIFQDVIGSHGTINLTGHNKQQALLQKFGAQGFDYAGDSRVDRYIWKVARKIIVVHPKWGVLTQARSLQQESSIILFPREVPRYHALLLALRPLFWVFNVIAPSWTLSIALSLFTSGLLIGNDLFTLSKERASSFKKSVFANGHLHLITAFVLLFIFIPLPLFLITSSLPWGIGFVLIYSPLFIGLDSVTRPLRQPLRWILLSLFQCCAVLSLSL
ncbi:MAG: hypothetical protein K2W92_07395 [Alphaproteobacteria bacterium]|nr:hypothetical protein [Alphaproteobacteria bacterium]